MNDRIGNTCKVYINFIFEPHNLVCLVNLVVGDAVFSCHVVGYIYIYKALLVSYVPYNLIEIEFGRTDFLFFICFQKNVLRKKKSVLFKPKCDFMSVFYLVPQQRYGM